VREGGLEPPHPYERTHLNPEYSGLPIPPLQNKKRSCAIAQLLYKISAGGGTRTPTPLRAYAPESRVLGTTNSATPK